MNQKIDKKANKDKKSPSQDNNINNFKGKGERIETSQLSEQIKKIVDSIKDRTEQLINDQQQSLPHMNPFLQSVQLNEKYQKAEYLKKRLEQIQHDVDNVDKNKDSIAGSLEAKKQSLQEEIDKIIKQHSNEEKKRKKNGKNKSADFIDEIDEICAFYDYKKKVNDRISELKSLDAEITSISKGLAQAQHEQRVNRHVIALLNQMDNTPFYVFKDFTEAYAQRRHWKETSRLILKDKKALGQILTSVYKQFLNVSIARQEDQKKSQEQRQQEIKKHFERSKEIAQHYLSTDFCYDVLQQWAARQQSEAEAGRLPLSPYYDQRRMAVHAQPEKVQIMMKNYKLYEANTAGIDPLKILMSAAARYVYSTYDEEMEKELKKNFFAWLNNHKDESLNQFQLDSKERERIQWRKALYRSDNNDKFAIQFTCLQLVVNEWWKENVDKSEQVA